MIQVDAGEATGRNHPLARRMAAIAFVNQNLAIAGVFGSFSVLLAAVEARLHISRQLSTLAIPAMTLAAAICGPFVGVLPSRHSLRLIMLVGAVLGVCGFVLLANTASYPLYLVAFGLLLGPAMSIGTILPSALVTRWFVVNRGKALGIVCASLVVPAIPLLATWSLKTYGLAATYAMLAVLASLSVFVNFFIVDRPPADETAIIPALPEQGAPSAGEGASIIQLLKIPRFWARTLAFSVSASATVMLITHIVPMGKSWGFSDAQSATLLAIQSVAGIIGPFLCGWLADRLGGVRSLILLMVDDAVLWVLLSMHFGFASTALLLFLFGIHSAGSIPIYGIALSEGFGRENFARCFGLANLINLPFSVLAVPAAALVYAKTGSYVGALLGAALLFALVGLFIFATRRERPVPMARA
jgi:predicted MFS family arabinose efflux permease